MKKFFIIYCVLWTLLGCQPDSASLQITTPTEESSNNLDSYLLVPPEFDSLPPLEWEDLLFANPDDQELWDFELKRVQHNAQILLNIIDDSNNDSAELLLLISNNHQLVSIALRHLGKYEEALQELSKSEEILKSLENHHDCTLTTEVAICEDIREGLELTYSYFANVFGDMEDNINVEKYINLFFEFSAFPESGNSRFDYLLLFYVDREDYENALNIVFDEIKMAINNQDELEIQDKARYAEGIYYELYLSISWIPSTGKLRENDPRDFADNIGLGIGRDFKYGMVDPEEDHATFATISVMQGYFESNLINGEMFDEEEYGDFLGYESRDEFRKNFDLETHIRAQLKEGNFEPVTKYLFFAYVDDHFETAEDDYLKCPIELPTNVTFNDVIERLEEVPSNTIPPQTIYVIERLYQGMQFLEQNCID